MVPLLVFALLACVGGAPEPADSATPDTDGFDVLGNLEVTPA